MSGEYRNIARAEIQVLKDLRAGFASDHPVYTRAQILSHLSYRRPDQTVRWQASTRPAELPQWAEDESIVPDMPLPEAMQRATTALRRELARVEGTGRDELVNNFRRGLDDFEAAAGLPGPSQAGSSPVEQAPEARTSSQVSSDAPAPASSPAESTQSPSFRSATASPESAHRGRSRENHQLSLLLENAYLPCTGFGTCREATWDPAAGHIPRGFLGATGALEDVELVMVFAEPGHPDPAEGYDPTASPSALLDHGVRRTHHAFSTGLDQFHRNVRRFMSALYPDLTFDQQLRHVWLTEGRLCSIDDEIGRTKDHTCAERYLQAQLQMLPNATVVAFGRKAQDYVRRLGVQHLKAYALAPPGANHKPAQPSWDAAIEQIKARRAQNQSGGSTGS